MANAIHNNHLLLPDLEIRLERRIKFFFLLPTLILRKIKGTKGINELIRLRLHQWKLGQLEDMITDLQTDISIVHIPTEHEPPLPSSNAFNIRRGVELISEGQVGRGYKALLSKGVSNPGEDHIKDQMKEKFPPRKTPIATPTDDRWECPRATLDREVFRKCIEKLKGQVSPGLTGFRNEHIQALLFSDGATAGPLAKSAFDCLFQVSRDITLGLMPWYFYQVWNGTSLTALNKKDPLDLEEGELMDCRPVCKGESLRKVITKALYSPYLSTIRKVCDPCQFGIGTSGGGSQLVMAIQLLLEANPSWTVISLDIRNAFNEIKRTAVLEALWENLALRPLWYYNFRCKTVNGFVGLGYGPSMQPAPFTCSEGEK